MILLGWTTYKVTRRKNEVDIGTMNINVPTVESPVNIGAGYYSLFELLSYPDFPIESHIFAHPDDVDGLINWGFPNVINASDYAGEQLVFDNGAVIQFSSVEQDGNYTYYWTNPDGTPSIISPITHYKDQLRMLWPLCIVGGDGQANFSAGIVDHINLKGTNANKLRWSKNTFPAGGVTELIFYKGATPIYTTNDPYGDGGISGGGGGTGSFDGTGDDISIPSLPTLSAVDAGFITLFNPTLGEMQNLASYMWSDLFDVDGWKKIFADPMGAILGLSIVPVNVPASGSKSVKVGNISTGVSMTVAASQYVEVDCGTLNVNEYWGAYLDYDPYTKSEIYLPYIGIHPISTDDIMNKPVHVVYHVDILSGACCAYVQCGGTVLYSFIGQCASSIPITGDNWTNVINGAISIAGSIGSMVATGGASAPMAIGQIASTAVNTMKPAVEKSGAMGGTGGMLGVQTPYLILTRPRQAVPKNQNSFIGYPAFITELLADLSGYTEIDSIHLENVPATEPELSEIESLLKGGVIF